MILLKRVEVLDAKEDEPKFTETEIAEKDIKAGDVIHKCYHDEGKGRPCKLQKIS